MDGIFTYAVNKIAGFDRSLEEILKEIQTLSKNLTQPIEVFFLEEIDGGQEETKVCDVSFVNNGLRIEFLTRKFSLDTEKLPFHVNASWPEV